MRRTNSATPGSWPIEAVLLDIDGTLIDSNDAHAHAWVEALQDDGLPTAFDIVRPLIGMGGTSCFASGPTRRRLAAGAAIVNGRNMFAAALPRLRATLGALLLQRSRPRSGLSSQRRARARSAQPAAEADLADLIDGAGSADDAEESKPIPTSSAVALGRAAGSPRRRHAHDVDADGAPVRRLRSLWRMVVDESPATLRPSTTIRPISSRSSPVAAFTGAGRCGETTVIGNQTLAAAPWRSIVVLVDDFVPELVAQPDAFDGRISCRDRQRHDRADHSPELGADRKRQNDDDI